MSTCKNCGAAIEWLTTAGSSLIPVDEEPIFLMEGRGTERFLTDEGEVLIGRPAKPGEEAANLPVAFVPHQRTCSNLAGFWREPSTPH